MKISIIIQGNVIRVDMNDFGASEMSVLRSIIITKSTPIQFGIMPYPFEGLLYNQDVVYVDVFGRRNYLHFGMFESSMNFSSNEDILAYFIAFLNS